MELDWKKCGERKWCSFFHPNMKNVASVGVYVIWCEDFSGDTYTVYVGQGKVAQRVENHRKEPQILQHKQSGSLFVTWADLPEEYRDGVEAFLFEQLAPVEGERRPHAVPIPVNLPQLD